QRRGCPLTQALVLLGGQSDAAGDIVYLASGSSTPYVGTFALEATGTTSTRPVTIEPAPGVKHPVLDGNNGNSSGCGTTTCTGSVLTVGDLYATVKGITVENGDAGAASNGSGGPGGGVYNTGV